MQKTAVFKRIGRISMISDHRKVLPLLSLQAIKELKAENDQLKQQLTEQQQAMAAIKKLLCSSQPQADLCTAKSLR